MVYTISRQSRDAERMRQMTETKRLYYEDVYKKEFTAKVLECREAKKGFHKVQVSEETQKSRKHYKK